MNRFNDQRAFETNTVGNSHTDDIARCPAASLTGREPTPGRTEAEAIVESGDVSKAVCSAADRLKPDLVVIGRGAPGHARLRTTTSSIIRESPSPDVSI